MPTISWSTKITLLLISSLTIMSIITISPALPLIAASFKDVPQSEMLVKLVMTVPALMIALTAPIAGRLIDKWGRLSLLWGALLVYAIAGSAGFYLEGLYLLLLSRIILGIAVGITMTIVITLVADYFDGMQRQQFVGIQVAFMSLAGIIFIGFGGVLADISWRYPFLIYLLALIVLPFALAFLKEPGRTVNKQVVTTSIKAPPFIWVLFVNTMIMWILFFLIPVQVPFHLKALGVKTNALIGAAIAMSTVFSAVSSFSFSALKNRFSFGSIMGVGYALMAVGFLLLSLSQTYVAVVVALIVCGLGIGMMIPNINMWVMKIAPVEIRGKEIGKLTTFWFMGQFLSAIVVSPILVYLSLSATFGLVASILLLLSISFFIYHWRSMAESVAEV